MTGALQDLAAAAARAWPQITGAPLPVMIRENAVFRVETTAGPHALRLHRPGYHSDAALASELAWMEMLARAGVSVPAPLALPDGGFLLTGPRRASLLSWEEGVPLGAGGQPLLLPGPRRARVFHAIGRTLAAVHRLSDGWTPPAGFARPAWDRDGLIGETPFWGRFWEAAPLTADQRRRFARFRDHAAERLDGHAADLGLIHADLVRENILVRGEEVCLIDFDDCGTGYRGFDLATCLRSNLIEPDYPDLRAALLDGYGRDRAVPDPDLLPLILALRALTYVSWCADRWSEPGMAARLPGYVALSERLLDGLAPPP